MQLVDSSCWLEYFAGTETGDAVARAIEDVNGLVVPAICIYEVFKKLLIERDEDAAIFAAAHMKQGNVVNLDSDLAIASARLGKEHKLPLADSIIYAVARSRDAILWTQDRHFEGLQSVKYLPKKK